MDKIYNSYVLDKNKLNHQVLDGIVDLIRVINEDNDVVFVNKSMEDTLKYNKEDLVCRIDESVLNSEFTLRTLQTGEIIEREELIDKNNYSVKCSPIIGPNDEILGVVEVFRNISTEKKLLREIIDKNEEMTVEMIHAKKIQTELLPKKNKYGNLNMDYIYKPSNMLSGDMFDIFKIDDENLAIYISDTVGHGFASSMITMFIRMIMRNINDKVLLNPAQTLKEVWTRFSNLELELEMYFTCFYGVYNRKFKKFIFSNAGHFPVPLIVRKDSFLELEVSGFPISRFLNQPKYENHSIRLKKADRILFMTDGLIENMDEDGNEFGLSRVKDIFLKNKKNELKILENDIYKFNSKHQKDDITALLLTVY